ncbi:hypothetical protein ARMSODRAFT_952759 [Armillaria solidipes]|uniref:Uncharacterized protein n=1 Tax=Armillaria solidipes TaxID=1076256 RepID=A0A2H3BS51_9AGAR|nr:hypothetical protein ARMSODRAFT_952759 [Armillaria solidipes]
MTSYLKYIGLFLVHLCMQMGPEYRFLEPPAAEDHLNEALQRLILNQIIEMEKDIDLNTVNFRETPELRRADLQKMAVPFRPSVGQPVNPPTLRRRARDGQQRNQHQFMVKQTPVCNFCLIMG